jgi:hypothetical protein
MSTDTSFLQEAYTLERDEYISDTSLIEDAVKHGLHANPPNVVISAAPGTGKSYAALTELQRLEEKFIFVADTKALADDLGSSENINLPVVHADTEYSPSQGESFITIPHHAPRFVDSDAILVVDEWHTLITAYDYKPDTIDDLIDTFSEFRQVIGFTGTNYTKAKKATEVTVQVERPPVEITPVRYQGLWSAIVHEVESRPDRTHFISLLDKSNLARGLIEVFEARGYGSDEITKFNSETVDDEEIATFKEENVFADEVKIVLSTYMQGFSVEDDHYTVHIAPLPGRRHSPTDIAQVVHRFRSAKDFDVNIYSNFQADVHDLALKDFISDQKRTAHDQIGKYREAFDGVKSEDKPLEDPSVLSSFQKEVVEDRETHRRQKENGKDDVNIVRPNLTTNEIQMYHNRYALEAKAAYQSPDDLRKELRQYNICLLPQSVDVRKLEGDTEAKSRSEFNTEEFGEEVKRCLEGDLTEVSGEIVRRVVFLSQYYEKESIREVMKQTGPRTENWNRLRERLKIQDPTVDLGPVSKEIYERFDEGKTYSNAKIQDKMRDVPQCPSDMSNKRVTTELQHRFDTEEAWPGGDRGHKLLSEDGSLLKPIDKPLASGDDSTDADRARLPGFLR